MDILPFKSAAAFERWLSSYHEKVEGVWIKFAKKDSGIPTVTYAEALDVALCHGWIDGQKKKLDDQFYLQKFTPRRARSIWSKRNTEHVERLMAGGKITPAGMKQIELAKADGRWQSAYDSPKNSKLPDDFLERAGKHKKSFAFLKTLNKANTFAIAWRLQTAKKPETRERRMVAILKMLKRGETFH